MRKSFKGSLGIALLLALSGEGASAQICLNAPGKASCSSGITMTGPIVQPFLAVQQTCTVPGTWTSRAGAKVTVNPNLTGTFNAPYCSKPHSLTVTLQGDNKFRVRLIWPGGANCQSATINMTFSGDCNTAQGPYANDDGTSGTEVWTRSGTQISLSRESLMVITAKGTPSGGTFSYKLDKLTGTSTAGLKTTNATDNPNTLNLTNPENPSGNGAPLPGGLARVTATYTTKQNEKVSKQFKVPTFGLSCYYTASEVDWGTPPNECESTRIKGTVYSGTVKDPHGLAGTYCNAFIAQLRLQGSAFTRDNRMVQYDPKSNKIRVVTKITGADGSAVEAGRTIARDRTIIPKGGVRVAIDRVGGGLLANDVGNDIKGYRIDLYKGGGEDACANFNNIISVAACTPGNDKCPARNPQ